MHVPIEWQENAGKKRKQATGMGEVGNEARERRISFAGEPKAKANCQILNYPFSSKNISSSKLMRPVESPENVV